jgi:hypothetical protein
MLPPGSVDSKMISTCDGRAYDHCRSARSSSGVLRTECMGGCLHPIEERDMVSVHGTAYQEYRRQVSMLLPFPKKRELYHRLFFNARRPTSHSSRRGDSVLVVAFFTWQLMRIRHLRRRALASAEGCRLQRVVVWRYWRSYRNARMPITAHQRNSVARNRRCQRPVSILASNEPTIATMSRRPRTLVTNE